MKTLKSLDVYKLAEDLADIIWNDFDTWPKKVQNTIGYQIIKSADSISANISEGYGRFHIYDRKKFYYYARGSFEETKSWIRNYIEEKLYLIRISINMLQ